jgi:hypothetical protein
MWRLPNSDDRSDSYNENQAANGIRRHIFRNDTLITDSSAR